MDSSLKALKVNIISFKKEKKILEGKEKRKSLVNEVYRRAEDTLFVVNLLAAVSHFLLFFPSFCFIVTAFSINSMVSLFVPYRKRGREGEREREILSSEMFMSLPLNCGTPVISDYLGLICLITHWDKLYL